MFIKAFSKVAVIICIILVFIISLGPYFVDPGHTEHIQQGTYNEDSLYDVLLMGSSHMEDMIDPSFLYDKYKITSYNYATGGQPLNVTYYLLEEALKVQSPKIVVLDLYYCGLADKYGDENYMRYALDNMKFSSTKLKAIANCVPFKNQLEYYFPFIKYHGRWSSLKESDFDISTRLNPSTTGYCVGDVVYGKPMNEWQHGDEIATLPEYSEKYINKFIKLSKEKNFDLIFVNAPYDYSGNNVSTWYTNDSALYNSLSVIASENNIPFLNYSSSELMDEIGFNFADDMYNIGHLNIYGSQKVNKHFADFLYNNYRNELT